MKNIYPEHAVMLIDDEQHLLDSLSGVLYAGGINNIITCTDSRQAMEFISLHSPSLILLDLTMPYMSGDELLLLIRKDYPELPVIIITGNHEISTAVRCMQAGAADYLVKAIESSKLLGTVRKILKIRELQEENRKLKEGILRDDLENPEAFSAILTSDKKMKLLFRYTETVSSSSHAILVRGETGTGKELFAEEIHKLSRRPGAFITVNAAGLDDTMFSDTLFGHKKGAFSGAHEGRKGLVEKAEEGTLFLDEIGDLSPQSQIKLLRLLENGEYYTLGSDVTRISSCRIVTATNRDLKTMMLNGSFRKDLYYRLSSYDILIPPLRERRGDIYLLTEHFVNIEFQDKVKEMPEVSSEFLTALMSCFFPGNIRELKSMILSSLSYCRGKILLAEHLNLPADSENNESSLEATRHPVSVTVNPKLIFTDTLPTLKQAADMLVDESMRRAGNNISVASGMIGISQPALSKRLVNMKKRACS
ncbi:MAG: sigma-54-dependent Fis family transcriptional regulator [Spirochaetales bacterium]|nr:sigma-54-dependent Fis family transcriptional regulator [Spirochaetales bacterium]